MPDAQAKHLMERRSTRQRKEAPTKNPLVWPQYLTLLRPIQRIVLEQADQIT